MLRHVLHVGALVITLLGTLAIPHHAEAGPLIEVRTVHQAPALLPSQPQTRPIVVVRPARPSLQHLWVEGAWVWTGRAWSWQAGYWRVPAVTQTRVVTHQPRPVARVSPATTVVGVRTTTTVRQTGRMQQTTTRRVVRRR